MHICQPTAAPQSWPTRRTLLVHPELVEDRDQIGDELVDLVVGRARRHARLAESPQIGRDHAEAGLDERGNLIAPDRVRVGEPVYEQDVGTLTLDEDVEVEAAQRWVVPLMLMTLLPPHAGNERRRLSAGRGEVVGHPSGADPCATAWMLACSCSAFSCVVRARLQVEDDLLDRARERVRRLVLVGEVDDETVVAADVHARRRTWRASAPSCRAGPRRSARRSPRASPSPPLPGLVSSASNSIFTLTSPAGSGLVDVCLYVSTPRNEYVWLSRPFSSTQSAKPPMKSALATMHALGAALGHLQLRLDRVRAPLDARHEALLDVLDVARER